MNTLQTILYFVIMAPFSVYVAFSASDKGTSRYRVITDWTVFGLVLVWELFVVFFVWTLIA